jgi:hypothetical protein
VVSLVVLVEFPADAVEEGEESVGAAFGGVGVEGYSIRLSNLNWLANWPNGGQDQ